MNKVLLIDREFGSGASTIADKVAHRLGWELLDHALTQEIARRAKVPPETCERCDERVDPWQQRLTNIIWRGSFERNLPPLDLPVVNTDWLVSQVQQIIGQAVAAGPCVIVGRGAPYFLHDRTDTFCVFLYASRELRFRRVLERAGNAQRAIELVDTMDEERRKFVKHYFGHEWPDRHLFHAMLNTAIGDDATVEAILYLMHAAKQGAGALKS
ncbi:MAG: AAA family ATPase [Limisphaerales bacterium]